MDFCGRQVDSTARVCSEHFLPEDFANALKVDMGLVKYRKLKKGVVPTVGKKRYPNSGISYLLEAAKLLEEAESPHEMKRNALTISDLLEAARIIDAEDVHEVKRNDLSTGDLLEAARVIDADEQDNIAVPGRLPLMEVANEKNSNQKELLQQQV
ncbi:PREDICTED: uncharacterized protein LOC108369608 [Rhagoletis zephyria]|uniref:uncharacterized protein LOC108369608 n=1 Tax=Rhagoletis zephyria TaxID=28612 RepID=UPI000811A57A|nr:PREDICTED: uncharacterized protein LOC108369608 [Rhagoletis zephyria]